MKKTTGKILSVALSAALFIAGAGAMPKDANASKAPKLNKKKTYH